MINKREAAREPKTKIFITSLIIFLAVVYGFFFSSKLIFPQKVTANDAISQVGETIEYTPDRLYTFVQAAYDEDNAFMEVYLVLENKTLDGIDDYYFVASQGAGTKGNLIATTKLNDPLLAVVRISGIKKFGELQLLFAPKLNDMSKIKEDETATLILNKYNVTYKKIDEYKNRKIYLTERLGFIIDDYEKQKDAQEKKIARLKSEVDVLESDNIKLSERMKIMTQDEEHDAKEKIETNNKEVLSRMEAIKIAETELTELKDKIKETEEAKANI